MPDAYLPQFLSREGRILPGEKRAVTVPQPAAGADWSVSVPGGRQWRVQSLRALLTTSAAVATRTPRLSYSDGTTIWWEGGDPAGYAASLVGRLCFIPLGSINNTGGQGVPTQDPLPDLWLVPGTVISVTTGGLDVGDQWSGIALFVEESWLDDQELTKLQEQKLAALGLEQTPWGASPNPGG